MNHVYIIADDLTGANDAGVQLSKIGITSTVFLDSLAAPAKPDGNVAIIDTDTRAAGEREASDMVLQASNLFHQKGYHQVYKKMDSTLRGNVAAELAAVVSVHQPEVVVIAPAYPKMNRQTLDGYQLVRGQRVSETEFGRDPKTPVKDSFIANLIEPYADKGRVVLLGLEQLRGPKEALIQTIQNYAASGQTWFICDAQTDEDLRKIAEYFADAGKKTVWAGSAGLIEYLPEALRLQRNEHDPVNRLQISKTLTVSASLSQVTKQQLEHVRTLPGTYFVELDPVDLVKRTYVLSEIMAEVQKEADKRHFVVFVDSSIQNREATLRLGAELSLGKTEISETISKELGVIAQEILRVYKDINGLILTGGDTAKAVCSQLNMNQMQLSTELEPGLPLGRLRGESGGQEFWAVTKAGGFGNEFSLKNALIYMSGEDDYNE